MQGAPDEFDRGPDPGMEWRRHGQWTGQRATLQGRQARRKQFFFEKKNQKTFVCIAPIGA
jgi:hypothetical protein